MQYLNFGYDVIQIMSKVALKRKTGVTRYLYSERRHNQGLLSKRFSNIEKPLLRKYDREIYDSVLFLKVFRLTRLLNYKLKKTLATCFIRKLNSNFLFQKDYCI